MEGNEWLLQFSIISRKYSEFIKHALLFKQMQLHVSLVINVLLSMTKHCDALFFETIVILISFF